MKSRLTQTPLRAWTAVLIGLVVYASSAAAATLSITQMQDIDFGEVPPTADQVEDQVSLCVNMDPSGPIRLTAIGSGSGGEFLLHQADPRFGVGFEVWVSNRRNRPSHKLEPGVAATRLMARRPLPNGRCRRPFTYLTVIINTQDLRSAPGGNYGGRLEITVAPE